jgi:hypothetical protein
LDVLNVIVASTIHYSIVGLHVFDETEQVRLVNYPVAIGVVYVERELPGEVDQFFLRKVLTDY